MTMNPPENTCFERAIGTNNRLLKHGPVYKRSRSLHEVDLTDRYHVRSRLTKRDTPYEGHFVFQREHDKGCIQSRREYGATFKGVFLEKSCAELSWKGKFSVDEEFYPILKHMLADRTDWGTEFKFKGLSIFMPMLMEWTQLILERHDHTLRQAEIFGVAAASQLPYMYNEDVWKAFCEVWGSLTNTLHHGGGEVGISLNDMKHIDGLPILGEPYEEFLPPNEKLADDTKYPSTILELLRIHTLICKNSKMQEVSWEDWVTYFYGGEHKYAGFGECFGLRPPSSKDVLKGTPETLPKLPVLTSISSKGELAAFLALLLSRFLLPEDPHVIRPETFVMASYMAEGRRISLAPTVLGHIYHGLNVMTRTYTLANTSTCFGIHFVVGWLGEYFPSLYRSRPLDAYPEEYPRMAYYAGVNGNALSIHQARLVFRHSRYVFHRSVPFGDAAEVDSSNSDKASPAIFEKILCIRSCVLPVRVGGKMIFEPYYPNRLPRQFGFDQAIPSNSLKLRHPQWTGRSLEDIACCYTRFLSKKTGAYYYLIPRGSGHGLCTWSFCSWWIATSAPYLSQSLNKINLMLKRSDIEPYLKHDIYTISNLRSVFKGLEGFIKIPEIRQASGNSKGIASSGNSKDMASSESFTDEKVRRPVKLVASKVMSIDRSPTDDVNPKRIRYARPSRSDETGIGETMEVTRNDVGYVPNVTVVRTKAASLPFPELVQTLPILFLTPVAPFARHAIFDGIKSIVASFAMLNSSPDPSLVRSEILQNLNTLKEITKAMKVSDVGLTWIDSRVHEFLAEFESVNQLEVAIGSASLINASATPSGYEMELASDKAKLAQLCEDSHSLKEREREIQAIEAKLRKLTKTFAVDKEIMEKETVEVKKKIRLNEANPKNMREAEKTNETQAVELEQKKATLKLIVESLNSLVSSG